ncbi:protein of unknown function DUF6 transmembrane [Bacteroides coprosuis DSM 18011]|uniref:EamA domain-containing protein n=1 Tax=Bacteroides coprosuis DSM 18011 TaxID=679937 RepID=F3ZU61_9BACE|nr:MULTISPECIES: EamA family transporter [Bacteroides]EGJ71306.1 protein of unknown function DUF6 transmembrane [Bacteroides coprosuis DSM 18011]HJD92932.1 EamA family transporter [Bacteroides coprosuis]
MKGLTSFKGIIYAMISSGTFGLIPLFTIPLVEDLGVNEANILFYRFFLSAIMMGIICLFRSDSLKIEKKQILPIFALGGLYALTALFLVYSYNYIASGVATTIHFLYPICVSLLMVLFFKEQKSKSLIIAALLSLLGVALMCWTDGVSMNLLGVFLASLTILTYGTYIVALNQMKVGQLPADVLTFYVILAGAIIFFVYAQFDGGGVQAIPSFKAGVYLIALAFLATVISDFALILAVKYAGSTVTAILGSMEPLVAVSVGILVFSEYFTSQSMIGLILILASVVLVILSDQRKKKLALQKVEQNK